MTAENVAINSTGLVDDLAAQWTDSTLYILKASGIKGASVPMEIEIWHTLKEVLQSALRWFHSFRIPPVSEDVFMEEVLLKATLRVAHNNQPQADAFVLEKRIRPLIQRQELNTSAYRRILRRRVTNGTSRPLSRSDYFPRMSAVGGYSRRVS